MLFDGQGRCLGTNRTGLSIMGCVEGDVIGKHLRDFFSEETSPDIDIAIRKVLAGERSSFDAMHERPYMSPIIWNATLSPIYDRTGKIYRFMGIFADVTERKLAEEERKRIYEALRDSEERYRLLFNKTPIGIFNYDAQLMLTACNDRFAEILQSSREKLLGLDMKALKDQSVMPALRRATEGEEGHYEGLYRATTGPAEIWVAVHTAPIFDENGRVKSCVGIVEDMTERKKMDDALRTSEKQYRMLFESSGDAIFVLEAEGDKAGKIVAANKAAATMHGYPIDELMTLSIADLHSPDAPRESQSQIDRLLKGEWVNTESTHRKKDGTIFPVEFSAGLLELGNHKYILAFDRDITDRRHMEEQMRHAQKMEALGTLTGGISHEFNNILQAIIGYGELLNDALKDNPLRTYSSVILSSAQRASGLTQGLLAYSRKQLIERKLVSLNEIIKKVEGLLPRFVGEDIDFRVILVTGDLIVNADSKQIEQVLMNLATNAKDAMPYGGVLTIRAETVSMEAKFMQAHGYGEPGMYALISVKDTGIGMNEKTRSRIFEPFFTTKGVGKGTGLGLSMVYGIVKAHNGFIDVQSAPGQGSTFNIYLPASKIELERVQSFAEPPPRGGSETVLVAEDDTEVRKLINVLLEKAGYNVIEAVDGQDAIEKMRKDEKRIQLLLCDVVMPKKNGREAFDEIIKIKPDIKVLFISAYTDDIIHEKGILAEGLHFISKPILPGELLRRVRDILDE